MHICSLRRAVVLVLKGVAVVEESTNVLIHSVNNQFQIPTVIRLLKYIYIPKKTIHLTRRNVLLRDKHICQYCGKEFATSDLTMDHIIPKASGGPTVWENVVTCCRRCNNRKGDKLPKEAGMKLIKKPEMPHKIIYLHIVRYIGRDMEKWKKYIFY